jgi:dsDNA-specific endonuclease/ATPase MutS2
MNKRTRKKQAKHHAAEADTAQSASSALQEAVHDFKDSATHLFETAWSELQQGAVTWVESLRSKAKELFSSIKPSSAAKTNTNSEEHAHRQSAA